MKKNETIHALVFAIQGIDCFISDYVFNDEMLSTALKHQKVIRALLKKEVLSEHWDGRCDPTGSSG